MRDAYGNDTVFRDTAFGRAARRGGLLSGGGLRTTNAGAFLDVRREYMRPNFRAHDNWDRTADDEFDRLMREFVRERCGRYGINPEPYLK